MAFKRINIKGEVLDEDGNPLADHYESEKILKSIRLENYKYMTSDDEIVEVYNYVFIIESIEAVQSGLLKSKAQYNISVDLDLTKIYLDYKDRFVIYSTRGLPCLLSEEAQDELFNLADEFSDEDITIKGQTYNTPMFIQPNSKISNSSFWSEKYTKNDTAWDLSEPSPALIWCLKKFKLPKLRVAVIGSGMGHDAHYFSTFGHKTVGFDFSGEAIEKSASLYGSGPNLRWAAEDIFSISEQYLGQFDLVFDHTLFCAIDPDRRDLLVKAWSRLLADQGQLLGIFFTMPKQDGPPYGSTEGELQDRLRTKFRTDYWHRSKDSHPKRLGKELIVLATKI